MAKSNVKQSTAEQSGGSAKSTRSASRNGSATPEEWLEALKVLLTNRPPEIRALVMNSQKYADNVLLYIHPVVSEIDGGVVRLEYKPVDGDK